MILEYVKPSQYRITENGKEIGYIKKIFINWVTKKRIGPLDHCDPKYLGTCGYELKWSDGTTNEFQNMADLGEMYHFDNYPGPRNVLKRNKKNQKTK